ncbi:hypothetical protein SCALM49S_02181 [Streptomyces californicus]
MVRRAARRYGGGADDVRRIGAGEGRGGSPDDANGRRPVAEAVEGASQWQARHREARATDDRGDYDGALSRVIGAEESTGQSFEQVDTALQAALAHEQVEFTSAARDGRGALRGLPNGAAVLCGPGGRRVIVGVNRRLSEYR